MSVLSFLIMFFTQLSVTSTGIDVSDLDVQKVLNPLTSWTGSLFNVVLAFAGVIIIVWIIRLFIRWIKVK